MLFKNFTRWALISGAVLLSAYGLVLSNPAVVRADGRDGSFISNKLSGDVLDHQLYFFLYQCFASSDLDKITYDELKEWRWFEGRTTTATRGDMYEQGSAKCEEPWLNEAFGRFGFTDPFKTFCALDFAYSRDTGGLGETVNGGNTSSACESGEAKESDFDAKATKENQAKAVDKLLQTASNYNEAKSALSGAAEYVRYYRTFMRGCEITLTQPYTDGAGGDSADNLYQVTVVNQDGSTEDWLGTGRDGNGVNDLVATKSHDASGVEDRQSKTCAELVVGLRDHAAAYSDYLKNEGADDDGTGTGGGSGTDEPVCSAGALGWVICPIINFISGMNDMVYTAVEGMLVTNPVTVRAGAGQPLYDTWTKFRDVANVLFVLAFLVVIFSQATSVGLSSYGVKKILPRIIASAILVNISFFICQVAIDISNIAGVSVHALFSQMRSGANLDINVISWSSLITILIGGGGAVAGIGAIAATGSVAAAMAAVLPFLVTALFAVITAIVVLVARQVIIILLVALAPLAFVAFILPNTQKYFQMWQNTFFTMLVMFPLVAALFAGSQLAANIILSSPTSPDGISMFQLIAAVSMLFIPLFGVPYIVKFSGGLLGRVAGVVNNPNKGPFDKLRKRAESTRDRVQNNSKAAALNRFGARNNGLPPKKRQRGFGASVTRNSLRDWQNQQSQTNLNNANASAVGGALSNSSSYARSVAGGRNASEEDIAKAVAAGINALDEIEAKNLKAGQTVLANAKIDGAGLKNLLDGNDATGLSGSIVKANPLMQMAAASTMMQQGREMDTVVQKLASSNDRKVREFAVGQMQSNFAMAKDKQVGLTDEAFMQKVIDGSVSTEAEFKRELTISTGIKAADLNPEKLASQDATSAKRIQDFVGGEAASYVTTPPPGSSQDRIKKVEESFTSNKIDKIASAAASNPNIIARANDDTARVIRDIAP